MYYLQTSFQLADNVTEVEYRGLVEISADATVFNDWPWLSVWIRHSTAEEHYFIACRTNIDNTLVAFLALSVRQEKIYGLPLKVARFLQYPYGDRIGLLVHPEHPDAWTLLLENLRETKGAMWDLLIFNDWADSQGRIEQTCEWAAYEKQSIHVRETCFCPVVSLEGCTYEEISARAGGKRKRNLRRCVKKLGELSHEISHGLVEEGEVESLLCDLTATEIASWKGEQQLGLFANPDCAEFFRDISFSLAASGNLGASRIYVEDTLMTYRYGFYFRDTFLDYSIAFSPEYRKLAPGAILLDSLIQYGTENGYRAIDASRVSAGTNHLIGEWADQHVTHYRFYWFSETLRGRLMNPVITVLKPRAKVLRAKFRKWKSQ